MARIDSNTPIETYFDSLEDPLRAKLLNLEQRFKSMGYFTVGSFQSMFQIDNLPDFNKARSLTISSKSQFNKASNIVKRKQQVSRSFGLSPQETNSLHKSFVQLGSTPRKTRMTRSEGYYGSLGKKPLRASGSINIVEVADLKHKIPPKTSQKWLLPDIQTRMGPAWDQGERGTCVSFAASSLAQYIHPYGNRPSPQFLFHQCKLLDGIPNSSGTYIETAMRVLANSRLSGTSEGWGTSDCGIPDEDTWPYNPSFIRGNIGQTPPPSQLREKIYSTPRWGSKGGEVIRISKTAKRVDEIRTTLRSANIPTVIGLPTFPSWINPYTSETGFITVPMIEDTPTGHHAMLICGYDDEKQLFLVRNSWGVDWAPKNPWGMPGYALIPYRYITTYSDDEAFSMRHLSIIGDIDVPEELRLYKVRQKIVSKRSTIRISDIQGKAKPTKRRRSNQSRTKGFWRRLIG